MDWAECAVVEQIPGKVSGAPIIRGSRVPVDAIVDSAKYGRSADDIAYDFDLSVEDVRTVLTYAERHAAATPAR